MAFNSKTFHRNKARKDAWAKLAYAREVKARVVSGEAYDWEAARLPTLVRYARDRMHDYLRAA